MIILMFYSCKLVRHPAAQATSDSDRHYYPQMSDCKVTGRKCSLSGNRKRAGMRKKRKSAKSKRGKKDSEVSNTATSLFVL